MSYYTKGMVILKKSDYDKIINFPKEWADEEDIEIMKQFPVTFGIKRMSIVTGDAYKTMSGPEAVKYLIDHQTWEDVPIAIVDVGETNHFPSRLRYFWDQVEEVPNEYILVTEDNQVTHNNTLGTNLLYTMNSIYTFSDYITEYRTGDEVKYYIEEVGMDAILKKVETQLENKEPVGTEDILSVVAYATKLKDKNDKLVKCISALKVSADMVPKILEDTMV